ncbi:MAG: 16S rRNA methyltransferase, partial [Caldiserica bacterium]
MRAKLGQNFLKSRDIAKRIVDLLELKENEKVLEIGGGKGILTQFLLKKGANVFVVEIDKKLVQYLKERFKGSKNLEIINCDILKPNKRLKEIFSSKNFKVIGNIPF